MKKFKVGDFEDLQNIFGDVDMHVYGWVHNQERLKKTIISHSS